MHPHDKLVGQRIVQHLYWQNYVGISEHVCMHSTTLPLYLGSFHYVFRQQVWWVACTQHDAWGFARMDKGQHTLLKHMCTFGTHLRCANSVGLQRNSSSHPLHPPLQACAVLCDDDLCMHVSHGCTRASAVHTNGLQRTQWFVQQTWVHP